MRVNDVDISLLEGWMIKINSNPTFFGKNRNRRWFKVGFVAGANSEKKLVISYASSKTAKDPRGWLYVEDVSGVYCRRVRQSIVDTWKRVLTLCCCVSSSYQEMIEIVSPSRTLRLKGETAVEHRLWSDSLYKLCTPRPKASSAGNATPSPEPRRKHTSHTRRDSNEDEEVQQERKRQSHREREHRHADDDDSDDKDSDRNNRRRSRDVDENRSSRRSSRTRDARERHSSSPEDHASRRQERESSGNSSESSCHDRDDERAGSKTRQAVGENRLREVDQSDEDSSEDDNCRPSTTGSSRSLLVSQIKSGSFVEAGIAQCKHIISDSEEEDEDDERGHKDCDPEEESPREAPTSTTHAPDDNSSCDESEQTILERMEITQSSRKPKSSDYFDSDEEDDDDQASTKHAPLGGDHKTPLSSIMADNNFVHDDWDAEAENLSTSMMLKAKRQDLAVGGLAVDANFVDENWD